MYNAMEITLNDVLKDVHTLQVDCDFDGLMDWCDDYENGVIQELAMGLVNERYHDFVLDCLRYEYHKSVDLLELWDEMGL